MKNNCLRTKPQRIILNPGSLLFLKGNRNNKKSITVLVRLQAIKMSDLSLS
jgi:hypothetical protein